MEAGSFRFEIGEFECVSVSDDALNYPPELLLQRASGAPLAVAARKARIVLPLPSMATLPGLHPRFCQPYLGSCGSGRTMSRLWS